MNKMQIYISASWTITNFVLTKRFNGTARFSISSRSVISVRPSGGSLLDHALPGSVQEWNDDIISERKGSDSPLLNREPEGRSRESISFTVDRGKKDCRFGRLAGIKKIDFSVRVPICRSVSCLVRRMLRRRAFWFSLIGWSFKSFPSRLFVLRKNLIFIAQKTVSTWRLKSKDSTEWREDSRRILCYYCFFINIVGCHWCLDYP